MLTFLDGDDAQSCMRLEVLSLNVQVCRDAVEAGVRRFRVWLWSYAEVAVSAKARNSPRAYHLSKATISAQSSIQTCVMLWANVQRHRLLSLLCLTLWFGGHANASLGDRLPDFKACVAVCAIPFG